MLKALKTPTTSVFLVMLLALSAFSLSACETGNTSDLDVPDFSDISREAPPRQG